MGCTSMFGLLVTYSSLPPPFNYNYPRSNFSSSAFYFSLRPQFHSAGRSGYSEQCHTVSVEHHFSGHSTEQQFAGLYTQLDDIYGSRSVTTQELVPKYLSSLLYSHSLSRSSLAGLDCLRIAERGVQMRVAFPSRPRTPQDIITCSSVFPVKKNIKQ